MLVSMPDKMNLSQQLLYSEFQKYEVMTMSVVRGPPKKKTTKKKNTEIPVTKQQNTLNALFKSLIITRVQLLKPGFSDDEYTKTIRAN